MRFVVLLVVACASPAPPPVAPIANHAPPPPAPPPLCRDAHFPADPPTGVAGSLDKNLIRHTMSAHTAELHACYEHYLEHASESGRLNATLTVAPDGQVGVASVTGFDPILANCVCEVVARIVFPAPATTFTVLYPIVFE